MSKQQLLLVDSDAKNLRNSLRVSLKNASFAVTTAVSERRRLRQDHALRARPHPPPTPRRCRRWTTSSFCKKLKQDKRFANIPFVFLTNDKSVTDMQVRGLGRGVDDYMSRPIYIKEIVTRIKLLLQQRENQQIERKDPRGLRLQRRSLRDGDGRSPADLRGSAARVDRFASSSAIARADLWFREGKIVDVEVGALSGEAAFYRLLTYNEGAVLHRVPSHRSARPHSAVVPGVAPRGDAETRRAQPPPPISFPHSAPSSTSTTSSSPKSSPPSPMRSTGCCASSMGGARFSRSSRPPRSMMCRR